MAGRYALNAVPALRPLIIAEECCDRYEGEKREVTVNRYERDSRIREMGVQAHGYRCKVCNMTFAEEYGEIGDYYIHIHHLTSFAESGGIPRKIDPNADLVPLCANCHAMAHRSTPPFSINALKRMRVKAVAMAANVLQWHA